MNDMNVAMKFLIGAEMVKKELPSDKQDKATQLGLIAALMPFPAGALVANFMAKSEKPSPQAATPPLLPPTASAPAPRSPVTLYVGDQLIAENQPISFGKRFQGEGDGKVRLTVTLKNLSGPTVELKTDISSGADTRFTMPGEPPKDAEFRPGDVLRPVIEFDTTTTGQHEGHFFVVVDKVERHVLLTGEIEERPQYTVKIRTQDWTRDKPQRVEFGGRDNKADILISNNGAVDLTISLLRGCDPAGYQFFDAGNQDVEGKLRTGLLIPKRTGEPVKVTVALANPPPEPGVTSLILTTNNQSPSFDDLLVAILEKPTPPTPPSPRPTPA